MKSSCFFALCGLIAWAPHMSPAYAGVLSLVYFVVAICMALADD